ncbi:MAG: AI-2E family transporter [Candidatus Paceibacterota bacterium]
MISFFSHSFQKIQTRAFFTLLILALILAVYMVGPYLTPVLWAAILASLFYPLYRKIVAKLGNENAGAGVTTALIVLIVLIPVSLIVASLIRELVSLYDYLRNPETIDMMAGFVERLRDNQFISQYIIGTDIQSEIENILKSTGSSLLNFVRESSMVTFSVLAKGFILLYTLFFFLRDGKSLLLKLERLVPFGDENERELYRRFTSTSRATLKGSVLVAAVQGFIAGIGYAIVGLPSIVFFSILTMFMAIIPALGASFVLIPIAIYLFITAPLWQGIILVAFALFINLSENVIRPALVGEGVQMHPALFVVSTLGGISLFGISGIVFGPVVMSFLLTLLDMYEKRYKKDIDKESTA